MKYLKTYKTYELKSSTYLSAADKLDKLHPKRAKKLRQFVDDQQKVDIDYLDPRPFHINNDIYYITGVELTEYEANVGVLPEGEMIKRIDIEFRSTTSDEVVKMKIFNNQTFIDDDIDLDRTPINMVDIIDKDSWGDERKRSLTNSFFFDTRKESRAFIQIVENEIGQKLLIKPNQIYKSE